AGTLEVDGSLADGVTLEDGATLDGAGQIGGAVEVQNNGTLSPGDGPGAPGILQTGPLTLDSGAVYAVEIDGSTAGSGYGQTQVTGAVTLGSNTATLD